jgi:hypothetical protein
MQSNTIRAVAARLASTALLLAAPFAVAAADPIQKGQGHFAMAGATDEGGATGTAGVWVNITDQDNRPAVKLNMTINGFASA